MAENSEASWWSSWLTAAREKSMVAYNITKRDLTEFMTTVQKDTTNAVNEAASTVRSYMQTSEGGTENKVENSNDTPETVDGGKSNNNELTNSTYDRSLTDLETIRNDPVTYCTIPEGQSTDYIEWSEKFDLSAQQEEISQLLISSSSIRRLQSDLVPVKVSYESFWHHYFYRIHLLNQTEHKRAELMSRVYSQGQLIRWDDDDDIEHGRTSPKAKTDSSESFVCISEDGVDPKDGVVPSNETPPPSNESPPPNIEVKDSDSDWEKWSDND